MSLLILLSLFGGKRAPLENQTPPMLTLPPPVQGVYLRSGFDTDPSSFIGRFLPAGNLDIDESNGMTTSCSKLVTYKAVGGGGVTYTEQFTASTAVSTKIGIPLVVGVEAGHSTGTSVRVEYTLLNKMVAEIADPAAFEACCKAAADQCTDRYISEFYEGTGRVSYGRAAATSGKVKGTNGTVAASIGGEHGTEWVQSIAFGQPVYFAFKTTPNAFAGGQAAGCGPWTDAPPKSTQGTYFVGTSAPAPNEAAAREVALRDARVQTVQWAGTAIQAGTVSVALDEASRAGLAQRLTAASTLETASVGVATLVKDEAWCVTPQATPDGTMFVAKVLAFLPAERVPEAAKVLAGLVAP